MSSQFDRSAAEDDGHHDLPGEAQDLYRALAHDGTAWRAGAAAEIERVSGRLRERLAQLDAASSATAAASPSAPSRDAIYASRGASARTAARDARAPFTRLRGWLAAGATIALVIAFLATLTLTGRQRPSGSAHNSTQPGVTATKPTGWVNLSRLDYSTNYSANDLPAIAPSDPNVVYETMARGMQQHLPASMRVTTDGGVTWRWLSLPVKADHIGAMGVGVSPINAQTVFLNLIDTDAADCPADQLTPGSSNAYTGSFCYLQYTSVDGGASWTPTDLPVVKGATSGMLVASITTGINYSISTGAIRAQGQRLYAGYQCISSTGLSCTRLVMSDDGGRSWRFADAALLAAGHNIDICEFDASLGRATVYAVTSTAHCAMVKQPPLMLWRSDDGGATWTKISGLATPNAWGMVLTQNSQTGAILLYIGMPAIAEQATDKMGGHYPIVTQSPSDVKVSLDGGVTWQAAPSRGIPPRHVVYFIVGLLGALSDGSVVVDVIPSTGDNALTADNSSGSALYAWKPGETSWRFIASVSHAIDSLLIVPSKTGAGDTLYTVLVHPDAERTFAFIRLDLSS